jgi:tape measure domain-containing protein
LAESNVGDIVARLRIDTTEWQRGLQDAQRAGQQFTQQTQQTQQRLSQLPFGAVQTAIDQFSRSVLNAGNSQARLQQAIAQAQQQFAQFRVTVDASGTMLDRFGQRLGGGMADALRQFQTGIREAQSELTALQRFGIDAAQRGGGAGLLGSILGVAGGLGLATSIQGIVRGAVQGLEEVTRAIVDTGVKLESLRLSFAGSFGGAAQGREAFRQTIDLAQRLGTNLETLAESTRRFQNAIRGTVLEGDRGRMIFENLATAARGLGLNTHETGQFMNAATQMIQRGAVSMEELRRQMGNVAPAIQVAARALGTTTENLERMVSSGKTQSIPFVEALARQFAQEFGPAAEGAGRSAASAFERLRTELTLLKEAIAQSGILSFLANVTQGVKDLLENMRALREERTREAGGPSVAIPPELAQSPAVQRRQAEIDALREALTPQIEFGEMPDISRGLATLGMTADQARARIRALEDEQRKAIDASKRMMDEEVARQQPMVTTDPRRTAAENLMKILREGQERLRDVDVRAQIEPDLDVLNEKLKITEKTLQDVRKAFDALGAGVQRPMMSGMAPSQYDPMLNRIATELGVDPTLAKALMMQESGGRNIVSRAGAIGPLQVMPGTGAQLGYTREQLFDPESNIRAGLTYLAQMLERFSGDVTKALTAYNAGPSRGGIPLPRGENATFARDVLARIPSDPLGVVAQAQRERDAVRQTLDDQKRMATEAATTIADMRRRLEDEARLREQAVEQEIRLTAQLERIKAGMAQTDRNAAEAARRREQVRGADLQREIDLALRDFEKSAELRQRAPQLAQQFQQARTALEEVTNTRALQAYNAVVEDTSTRIFRLGDGLNQTLLKIRDADLTPVQAATARVSRQFVELEADLRRTQRAFEDLWETAVPEQRGGIDAALEAIAEQRHRFERDREAALRRAREEPGEQVLQRMQNQLEQMRSLSEREALPFEESREQIRLRQEAAKADLTPQQQAQFRETMAQIQAQRELNYGLEIYYDLAGSIGNAWTQSLTAIASGTQSVSNAFKAMAQSILQSMAQIASQEAFRALIRIGAGLLTSAFSPTVGTETAGGLIFQAPRGGGVPATPPPLMFGAQHGAVVTRPTHILAGEGPSHTLPEVIMNRQQMQQFMASASRAGSSPGGQGAGGISIINVASREEADRQAAEQRAMGKQVILNEVLGDMQKGEGSQINRMMRLMSR